MSEPTPQLPEYVHRRIALNVELTELGCEDSWKWHVMIINGGLQYY
jgi:hypothetical protein